ncbi:MAG: repeat protein, partial [Candidatus Acidoferrum typicum]|nr:repeat protein [Candidatus Acidoferrum typicum]
DLIVAGGGVAVLLGKGNGAFWGPAIYNTSSSAGAVQVADVDGDGKLDVAVTSGSLGSTLSVLRGRGYGTFDAAVAYSVGAGATGLAVADFNGDGGLDVAVTNTIYAGNTVTVLLNEPIIALFPSMLTFAAQTVGTTSSFKSATINNPGTSLLDLNSIVVTGANASDFLATTTCGTSLVISKNCVVKIKFRPSATGTRVAALKITDNALGGTQFIQVQGTGK